MKDGIQQGKKTGELLGILS